MISSISRLAQLPVLAGLLLSCDSTVDDTFECVLDEKKFEYIAKENTLYIIEQYEKDTKKRYIGFKSGNMHSYSGTESLVERRFYYIPELFYIQIGTDSIKNFANLECRKEVETDGEAQIFCRNDVLKKDVVLNWSRELGVQKFVERYDSGEVIEYRLVGKEGLARVCKLR